MRYNILEYKPKEYDATNAVVQVIKLLRLVKQNNVRENVSMIQLLELWCGNGKIWKELKHFVNDSELEILKARKTFSRQIFPRSS